MAQESSAEPAKSAKSALEDDDKDAVPKNEPKTKEKIKRPREMDPLDWDEDAFPKMADREAVQAKHDPMKLAEMRATAKKKMKELQGQDPATFERRWHVKIALLGIENTTNSDWNVFLAVRMGSRRELDDTKHRLKADFSFTKSYLVEHNSKKQLQAMEVLFSTTWDGSYKKLSQTEVAMDLWLVSPSNFNQILGTARKSLYDMGNDSVFQTLMIKPIQEKSSSTFDIGILHVNAVVSEMLQFTIVASNWQFAPRPELQDDKASKKIRIDMPTEAEGPTDSFESAPCQGPRYTWGKAGEFVYEGTHLSLAMEAITITVISSEKVQGKAIVSMGVAAEYPIAQGMVKALSKNVNTFVQGRIAGNISVTSKSLLLEDGMHDEDSSIEPPYQPPQTLVLFFLSPNLQYLVVEMYGADGLPIADQDLGSANPLCRVKFDGLVQQSPALDCTLSPAWNHTFYLPVRMPDDKIRTDKEFYKTLMPVEMKSKGLLEIEVWHFDSVPTEFMGGCKFDLHQTRYAETQQKALCQSKVVMAQKSNEEGEEAEEESEADMGIHPALVKKHTTKVYEAKRVKLSGSWLQSVTKATVSFQCYFIPDFPEDFRYPEQDDVKTGADTFNTSYKKWENLWPQFQEAYSTWFPDALRTRRFLYSYQDAGGDSLPLPTLISPLALPASLATPNRVAHWIRCTEFSVPPRQRSCAEIGTWQRPEDVLSLRRGSVQDHAVLLCCALLGLGKNAFVCKGTLQKGKEHAWVMTREHGGTVTFWETTTGAKYHLANRWLGDPTHSDKCKAQVEDRWKSRKTNAKWKDKEMLANKSAMNRSEQLQNMSDLATLPISPWRELYQEGNIVVVPYETIEVVFNGFQLWGNLGNHHPACIYFDMEDDHRSWQGLISEEQLPAIMASQGVALPVGPTMSKFTVETMQDSIEAELKESIRMIRMRQGHESYFEEDHGLQESLEQYLAFLESECYLEADWVYDQADKAKKPWGSPSPFNSKAYVEECRAEWATYWQKRQAMDDARVYLPVKENHVLSGLPLHLSSTDLKEIRNNLLACKPLMEYFSLGTDDAIFFSCVKVFPMPSMVASVWVFLGVEVPLPPETIQELAQLEMDEFMRGEEVPE